MDYEKKYKQLHTFISDLYPFMSKYCQEKVEGFFPELKESEDERIRKELIRLLNVMTDGIIENYTPIPLRDLVAWLEKQGEQMPNPYSGISFEYNGHIWGMCARDNGIDILFDKQLFKHLDEQGEQNPTWSENDELNFKQAIYVCHRNGYTAVENWLKSFRPNNKWKPTQEQMSCFKQAIDLFKMKVNDDLVLQILNSLYDELEKL